jgi:hypothetical protein
MNGLSQNVWTYELVNGTLLIDTSYGLTILSLVLTAGAGTVLGSYQANGVAPTAIPLVVGQPITISSDGNNLLGDFFIDANAGSVSIMGK